MCYVECVTNLDSSITEVLTNSQFYPDIIVSISKFEHTFVYTKARKSSQVKQTTFHYFEGPNSSIVMRQWCGKVLTLKKKKCVHLTSTGKRQKVGKMSCTLREWHTTYSHHQQGMNGREVNQYRPLTIQPFQVATVHDHQQTLAALNLHSTHLRRSSKTGEQRVWNIATLLAPELL